MGIFSLNGNFSNKPTVKLSDYVAKDEATEAPKEEETKKEEELIFKGLGGNGENEEQKPITIEDYEKAIEDVQKDTNKTQAEKASEKEKLENQKEKEKLEDAKKANFLEDEMKETIKFDKDLQHGLEYAIKNIQDEQVQQKLLKELAIMRLADRIGEDKEKTEQKINLVYEA